MTTPANTSTVLAPTSNKVVEKSTETAINKVAETIVEAVKKGIKPGFFSGVFRNWQDKAYKDLLHAGVDNLVAHKVCMDYSSDLGRAMSKEENKGFKSKIGKLNDDGDRTITFAGKSIIKTSDSMSVVVIVQTMDQLFKEELLASRKLPALSTGLETYLSDCDKWTKEQTWDLPNAPKLEIKVETKTEEKK